MMETDTHIVEYLSGYDYNKLCNDSFDKFNRRSKVLPILSVHSDSYRVVLQKVLSSNYYTIVPQVCNEGVWSNNGYLQGRKKQFAINEIPSEEELITFMEDEFYKKYPDAHMGFYSEDPSSDEVISMLIDDPTSKGVTEHRLTAYKSVGFKENEVGYGDFTGEISIRCSDCSLYIPYVQTSDEGYILVTSYARRVFSGWEEGFSFYWNKFCDKIYNTVSKVYHKTQERRYHETQEENQDT